MPHNDYGKPKKANKGQARAAEVHTRNAARKAAKTTGNKFGKRAESQGFTRGMANKAAGGTGSRGAFNRSTGSKLGRKKDTFG